MAWQVLFLYFGVIMAAATQFHYSILEEMKLNSVIGNVADDLKLNSSNLKMRKLRLVSHHNRNYFNISTENGNLYVSNRIDREEICGSDQNCFLDLEILAENPVIVFPLKIEIQDINDNSPSFSKESFTVRISESSIPGAQFVLGNVRDPDLGTNSLQSYSVTPNPYFALVEKSEAVGYIVLHLNASDKDEGSNAEISYSFSHIPDNAQQVFSMDSQTGIIQTKGELNFELTQTFEMTVEAIDGGGLVAQSSVLIQVEDVNDNAPDITIASLSTPIPEDSAPGTLVALIHVKDLDSVGYVALHLNASDKDEGSNAEISYSFSHIPIGYDVLNINASDKDEGSNAEISYSFGQILIGSPLNGSQ